MYTQRVSAKQTNTVIIGAGQAGLSTSYFLTQKGVDHVVLEKGIIADSWHNRRWDAFHLITPNHMTHLPGFPYSGNNPHGFDSKDEIVQHLKNYAHSFTAPVLEHTKVESVKQTTDGFEIKTNHHTFKAKNIVVAIGSFHQPIIPEISKSLPKNILQLHSNEYKNSKQLPSGEVLVVGAGNSGVQIAVDLQKAGRTVYLSLGSLRIVPRNYRGKDFMEWAQILGALDKKTEDATPEVKATLAPLLFGYNETVNFHKLAQDGINLVGRLKDYKDGQFVFDNNVLESIEKGEAALTGFKKAVDDIVKTKKLDAPNAEVEPPFNVEINQITNVNGENIRTVIWATGFKDDWSFLNVPVFDEKGEPIHTKGVSKVPGLYFMGLRWMSKYKSFLLCGVAEDAQYISSHIH